MRLRDGKEYERFIASLFHPNEFYVERGVNYVREHVLKVDGLFTDCRDALSKSPSQSKGPRKLRMTSGEENSVCLAQLRRSPLRASRSGPALSVGGAFMTGC